MRVLIQIDDEVVKTQVERLILANGHVLSNRDAKDLDAIVLGDVFQQRSGRQRAVALRAQAAFFECPIVAVVMDAKIPAALCWLRVGVVDVVGAQTFDVGAFEKLIAECQSSRIHTSLLRQRFLSYARRHELHGTLLGYPDTPFEAELRFDHGALTQSRFMTFSGNAALDATLELDDAPAVWVAGDRVEPPTKADLIGQSRVLVVEDDDALRTLTVKRLEAAGYQVQFATDGRQGLNMALADSFDAAVIDLNLPTLDGWGILRHMKEDLAARETAVMVVSAHSDFVDTLKAAKAGARAYLHKSGRAKDLLQSVELLVQPRQLMRATLAKKLSFEVETRLVGVVWLFKALAEFDAVGRLNLEDELGRYEVIVARGQLIAATAQVGSMRYEGDIALEAMITARAKGTFTAVPTKSEESKPWIFDVIDRVCRALSAGVKLRMEQSVQQLDKLSVNSELAQLYGQMASVQDLRILESAMQNAPSVEALATQLSIPVHEIEATLAELLRRGVFSHGAS
jgi:CheY-like chemotaxis protein